MDQDNTGKLCESLTRRRFQGVFGGVREDIAYIHHEAARRVARLKYLVKLSKQLLTEFLLFPFRLCGLFLGLLSCGARCASAWLTLCLDIAAALLFCLLLGLSFRRDVAWIQCEPCRPRAASAVCRENRSVWKYFRDR